MMRRWIAPLLLALVWVDSSLSRELKDVPMKSETFRLDNGLTVILRPIQGADEIALVVLYDIGGDHDPRGRSGLAHLVEHVYVTAAAGDEKMRTAEAYMQRYRAGCNAQTGDRYTVIATIFAKADLNKELRDAAARMGDLRVTAADLDREKPRIDDEVANMFGRIPSLGARNNAHELVRPTPHGGRRGGLPEQVRAATLEEVQQHWKRYYKPRNAILALAGDVDGKATRQAVRDHFAKLPAGEKPPAPAEPGQPKFGTVKELTVESIVPQARPEVCLAYAAPAPSSDRYAPFLVHVARLFASAEKQPGGPERFPVHFAMLDDPAVLSANFPARRGESVKQARERLEAFVKAAVDPKLDEAERDSVRETFGFFLGVADVPDRLLAQNPYGVAFSLGRRHQLGIDPIKLKKSLAAVTDEDLRLVAKEIFASDRHAGAFLSPKDK
ncbi:MAG TPA: pitrilysin family protein [Gemmataceae bacterium]